MQAKAGQYKGLDLSSGMKALVQLRLTLSLSDVGAGISTQDTENSIIQ